MNKNIEHLIAYSNSDSDSIYEVHNLWAGLDVCTHEHAFRKLRYNRKDKFDPDRDCPALLSFTDMTYVIRTPAIASEQL